jgi:hypothetical protein
VILLAEHDEVTLAAKKKRRRVASGRTTSTPKNRVWGFENTPLGRPNIDRDLTRENATGSNPYSYEKASGRAEWLSRDPLQDAELSQGANLYWYVFNNAVNGVDPTGLAGWTQGTNFQFATGGWTVSSWTAQWQGTGSPDASIVSTVTGTYTATVSVDCKCGDQTQRAQGTRTFTGTPQPLPSEITVIQTDPTQLPTGASTLANSAASGISKVLTEGAEAGATVIGQKMASSGMKTMMQRHSNMSIQDQNEIQAYLQSIAPQLPNVGGWVGSSPCDSLS